MRRKPAVRIDFDPNRQQVFTLWSGREVIGFTATVEDAMRRAETEMRLLRQKRRTKSA